VTSAIHIGGVEEVDASVKGNLDRGQAVGIVARAPFAAGNRPQTQSDIGDEETAG
jgi:hypothetical protein